MEKRRAERIPANINVRFFHGNMFYAGTILNISEKNMLISTRKCLPANSTFVIVIHQENRLLKVVARVKRLTRDNGFYDGMGVELVKIPASFKEFIDTLKIVA